MTVNICQDALVLDAVTAAPCDTCALNVETQECPWQLAARMEIESPKPDEAKRHLFDTCSGWRPRGAKIEKGISVLPELIRAKVKDCCVECPDDAKSACSTRHALDEIESRAIRNGRRLRAFVYSCYPKSQDLYQIRNPST